MLVHSSTLVVYSLLEELQLVRSGSKVGVMRKQMQKVCETKLEHIRIG
jgi:hypothetical protein